MKKNVYCFNCNNDVQPNIIKQTNTYNIHKKSFKIEEEIFTCPFCNCELCDENLDDSLYKIYDGYLNLFDLSFEKMKKIRNSYNLSQELFAVALGWSKRTIIRYENAESLPQNQNILIYKSIDNNKNEFINILTKNKSSIDKDLYYKIYDLINTDLDLKTINVFLYILKNNFLTKTQIMKNMFSIDFQSYKEYNKPITSLKYAHGTYGPIIDKKDAYLNILIRQNYLEIVNDEEDNLLFKPVQNCDLSLFTKEELEVMNKVKEQLKGKSSSALTEWSHKFKGWSETKNGEKINYSYANDFELLKNW